MPKAQPAPRAFDPRSAAPTLAYVGPATARGVPARDLSDADLARLAFDGLPREDRPAAVPDVPDALIVAIRDELLATGLYTAKED